jgi:hypothetical protein
MRDGEQQHGGEDIYTDRDEEIVATVLASDHLLRAEGAAAEHLPLARRLLERREVEPAPRNRRPARRPAPRPR